MTNVTVFGAGAAGTAIAIHLAREGARVIVWGSEHDARVLPEMLERRRHPALPEHLPGPLRVLGPGELAEAGAHAEVAIMGASSAGARPLSRLVAAAIESTRAVVSIAKGFEPGSRRRMSEVYAEELPGKPIVALSGPSLAAEIAEGLTTAVDLASTDAAALAETAALLRSERFLVDTTDDVAGVEICGVAKNVAAIGAGILEGLSQHLQQESRNPRAALFTRAVHEIARLVEAAGGRRDTAFGLAGMGDLLVTSLGGRNRMYGETIGRGGDPHRTLSEMTARGLTVEGAESAQDVHELAKDLGLELPVHEAVYRIVHESSPPDSILEALR